MKTGSYFRVFSSIIILFYFFLPGRPASENITAQNNSDGNTNRARSPNMISAMLARATARRKQAATSTWYENTQDSTLAHENGNSSKSAGKSASTHPLCGHLSSFLVAGWAGANPKPTNWSQGWSRPSFLCFNLLIYFLSFFSSQLFTPAFSFFPFWTLDILPSLTDLPPNIPSFLPSFTPSIYFF